MQDFLSDYGLYTSGNESPRIFHAWAGLSTLSNFIGRRCWVSRGGLVQDVYCQLFIILAGDPGVKKSTAMRVSKSFVAQRGDVVIAPASITKEAMTQLMGSEKSPCQAVFTLHDTHIEYRHLAIYADEFVNLINAGGNPIGMIDFFTEIWTADKFQEQTKNKGTQIIQNPYVSMLCCMTTDTVKQLYGQRIISGGMTRRCVFIYGKNEGASIPFPEETPEQLAALARLKAHGHRLKAVAGEFGWSAAARQIYTEWYHQNTKKRETEPNPILRQFYESKAEYVLKLSMLLALSKYENLELVIQPQYVQDSVDLITSVERGAVDILSGSGRNPFADIGRQVLEVLKLSLGPIEHKRLFTQFRNQLNYEEFTKLMEEFLLTKEIIGKAVTISAGNQKVQLTYYSNEGSKFEGWKPQ